MDSITGGTIATDGVVKLKIDSDKIGYIKLPNGAFLTTVAGIINTTNTGVGGKITYYLPKTNLETVIDYSGLAGDVNTSVIGTLTSQYALSKNMITSVTAPNCIGQLNVSETGTLTNVVAPKALVISAQSCALTAKSIGDILYSAYKSNRLAVNYNFTGGSNAAQGAIDSYLISTYQMTIGEIMTKLVTTNGGTVLLKV